MTEQGHLWHQQQADRKAAELSYHEALRRIDALHVRERDKLDGDFCGHCGHSWPCKTNQIIEKARKR